MAHEQSEMQFCEGCHAQTQARAGQSLREACQQAQNTTPPPRGVGGSVRPASARSRFDWRAVGLSLGIAAILGVIVAAGAAFGWGAGGVCGLLLLLGLSGVVRPPSTRSRSVWGARSLALGIFTVAGAAIILVGTALGWEAFSHSRDAYWPIVLLAGWVAIAAGLFAVFGRGDSRGWGGLAPGLCLWVAVAVFPWFGNTGAVEEAQADASYFRIFVVFNLYIAIAVGMGAAAVAQGKLRGWLAVGVALAVVAFFVFVCSRFA